VLEKHKQSLEFSQHSEKIYILLLLLSLLGVALYGKKMTSFVNAQVQQNKDIEHIFTHSIDLMCIANTDGTFKRLSPSFENILGYKKEELLKKKKENKEKFKVKMKKLEKKNWNLQKLFKSQN
jgi:PAS domain-containing protein